LSKASVKAAAPAVVAPTVVTTIAAPVVNEVSVAKVAVAKTPVAQASVKTVTKVGYVIDPNSAFRIRIDAIGQISPLNLESLVGSVERGDNQAPIRILAEQV
jgi:hypothetical protein